MKTITYTEVQRLVEKLPEAKLPLAYCLLVDLANRDIDEQSPQAAFMRLPLAARRRLLAQQAEQMKAHYKQAADEPADV